MRSRPNVSRALAILAPAVIWAAGSLFPVCARADEAKRFEMGGYGEALYRRYGFGPPGVDSRAIMDIPRLVLEFEYYFLSDLRVESEIEYEHGGIGAALEDGAAEPEVEKGGEVVVEEFHITKRFSGAFQARAGHFIVPVGLLNTRHHPHQFFTAIRPESETSLIPTTWHETGAEAFGKLHGLEYRLGVVNGLDASGFESESWIRGGFRKPFETAAANDLAFFARLDFIRVAGLLAGVSSYYGNSTHNRPSADMEHVDGHVSVSDVHGEFLRGPFAARGVFLYGTLENADSISVHNGETIGRAAMLWYGEVGYDVLSFLSPNSIRKLYPFVRYEHYNAMQDVAAGFTADPALERNVFTGGINLFLSPTVVLKADVSHRTFGDDAIEAEDTFSIALGFSGTFLDYKPGSGGTDVYQLYEFEQDDDDD